MPPCNTSHGHSHEQSADASARARAAPAESPGPPPVTRRTLARRSFPRPAASLRATGFGARFADSCPARQPGKKHRCSHVRYSTVGEANGSLRATAVRSARVAAACPVRHAGQALVNFLLKQDPCKMPRFSVACKSCSPVGRGGHRHGPALRFAAASARVAAATAGSTRGCGPKSLLRRRCDRHGRRSAIATATRRDAAMLVLRGRLVGGTEDGASAHQRAPGMGIYWS
jgi:hypothetical protein